jgi:hypothetical protein
MPLRGQICSTGSADEADLGEMLAEERLGVACAVQGEPVAHVEAVRAWIVLGDPQVQRLALGDGGVEQPLADAGTVVLRQQVDEVQLALARPVLVARGTGADEPDDLAVDEGRAHVVLGALRGPVRPEFREPLGRDALERGRADVVVVGLVPARRVHSAEGLGVHVANRTDHDVSLQLGVHGETLRGPVAGTKSSCYAV